MKVAKRAPQGAEDRAAEGWLWRPAKRRFGTVLWLASQACASILACTTAALAAPSSGSAAVAEHPADIPVKDFVRAPEFTQPKLSPDGSYIAYIVPSEKKSLLQVIRVADRMTVGSYKMDEDNHVAGFWWVSDSRIVATLATQLGALDTPSATGELVAFDANGSSPYYLYGYRKIPIDFNPEKSEQWGGATMLDPLIDDPDHALIALRSFAHWEKGTVVVCKINIHTGDLALEDASPFSGGTSFLADASGNVRYAMGYNGISSTVWQRLEGEKKWHALATDTIPEGSAEPLQFAQDGKSVYLSANGPGSRSCLVQQSLVNGERHDLACDPVADLDFAITSFNPSGNPIAAVFEAAKPRVQILDPTNPSSALLQSLMAAFPGKVVRPVSVTRDGRLALVLTYDDRTPGDYYLFDTKTQKADYFGAIRQWLDPDLMPERRPIELKARDGTVLHGYLTLPHGVEPKGLPLVVNPHGGPFGVRDHWGFSTESALLASRGYAVLQLNFRGSSGYGSTFADQGKKAWGTTMIDDITDATHWAVDKGYAAADRICIYGASYGGYAALMSAVREPALYRCIIGYAGVYDLGLLKRDADFSKTAVGKNYFTYSIAGTDDEIQAQSPIAFLDRLKAPMLIVHGEEDVRSPYSQAKALRSAMKAGKHPFEWLTRDGEGHGFQRERNVQAFYETLLAFLDQHIGRADSCRPIKKPGEQANCRSSEPAENS